MTGRTRPHREQREHARVPVVVVGFDGSPSSEHALVYAAGTARRLHATLVIAYIADVAAPASLLGLAPFGPDTVVGLETDRIATAHGAATEILAGLGVWWRFTARAGDPVVELTRLAREESADIVVVGRSSTWWRRLAGSVPARLTRRAGCPVTVVP